MAKKKKNTYNWGDRESSPGGVLVNASLKPVNSELRLFNNPGQRNIVDTEKRFFNNSGQRTIVDTEKRIFNSSNQLVPKSNLPNLGPTRTPIPTQVEETFYIPGQRLPYRNQLDQHFFYPYLRSVALGTEPGQGGGGSDSGGGGGGEAAPVTWEAFDSKVAGAPDWWKALKPSEMNEATEYLASLNMMIPFLSPEDQRSVAANLYQQNPEAFAHLNPETIDPLDTQLKKTPTIPPFVPPSQMTTDLRKQFTSAQRYTNALTALTQLASAVGKSDAELGPGYRYLRSILNTGQTFGAQPGAQGQTRRNYLNQMGALDPLLSQTQQQSLSPYSSIARMLSQPYFTAGQLVPVQRTQDGRYLFGEANKELL
jgi:hypothetical protein